MIYIIKKKLQFLFKLVGYKVFFLLYGKIEGKINKKNNIDYQITNISLDNQKNYNFYRVPRARLYTDRIHNTAVILNNKIIDGASFQFGYSGRFITDLECEKNIVFKIGTPRLLKKLQGSTASFLTGGAGNDNYFHWMFDVLPRLAIIEKEFNVDKIDYFLFPDLKKKFQNETLNILNIPNHKRLSSEIYRHIASDNIIATDHPYSNSNPTEDIKNIPKWISSWLKKKFIKEENLKENFKNIYITRKDSTFNKSVRKIINEDEVISFFKKKNFEIITLSDLQFSEQVSLFNNANLISGLHGAGLANLVFSKRKTKILEIKSITAGDVIKNLALSNELQHKSIDIEPISHGENNQNGNIIVNIEDLKEKLNTF